MGLGRLLHLRNLVITQTDTLTGESMSSTIVTGPGPGGSWPETGWGGQQSWYPGLGLPSAWRCTQLLTDVIGNLPWQAFGGAEDAAVLRTPTPTLLANPAGRDTAVTTFSAWALDLIWNGNAVGIILGRDGFGEPSAVLPVPARWVQVKRVEESDGLVSIRPGTVGYWIGGSVYSPDDMVHIKGLCEPGGLRGWGVLEAQPAIRLAGELQQRASEATGAGIPLGVLKSLNPDLDQVAADDAAAKWEAKMRTRRVAVLNAATEFTPLSWNPSDAQLIEARQFSDVQMAQVFGVDPEWLGAAQSSRVYSNVEMAGIELVRRSALLGHLGRFEAELSYHLQPGSWAKANLDAQLRADTKTRYEAHQIGITAGFLTDDEVRALEDLPPLTPAQRAQIKASKPLPPAPPAGGKPGEQDDQEDQEEGE